LRVGQRTAEAHRPLPRRASARLGRGGVAVTLAVLVAAGCYERASLAPPPSASLETGGHVHTTAKFHLKDGRLAVLDQWRLEGAFVHGRGRGYGVERALEAEGDLRVPVGDIVLVETTEERTDPAMIPLAIVTGASLALTTYCLANTKACFGSCPTFYVKDPEQRWQLQAEGFSSSIARLFEADDVDDLPDAVPRDGSIGVQMRNEALETHMIRRVSMIVVHDPAGGAVYRGFGDGYLSVGPAVAPDRCTVSANAASLDEGTEVSSACAAFAAKDAAEWALESDGRDLASRTSLALHYPPPGKRDVALVVTARNSLMSTFVLYQMIAYQGRAYGDFQAALERGDPAVLSGFVRFGLSLGGIDVSVRQGSGAWRAAGSLGYIGPIARASRALRFEVDDPSAPVDVRLELVRAHWKIDAARLAPLVSADLAPVEVAAEVESAPGRDLAATEASVRGVGPYLVTTPGDEAVFRFPVGAQSDASTTGYFLHTRGYYYEWMRDEWVREEDLARARRYFEDPSRAFRELAPAYRTVEPSMEAVFRASRFMKGTP
jgi:hypothetical protein